MNNTIKKAMAMGMALVVTATSFTASVFATSNSKAAPTALFTQKTFQQQPVTMGLGPWQFYAAKSGNRDTSKYEIMPNKMEYRDGKFASKLQVMKDFTGNVKPWILSPINSSSGEVQLVLDKSAEESTKVDAVICFTVPENGTYEVDFKGVNKGNPDPGVTGGDGVNVFMTVYGADYKGVDDQSIIGVEPLKLTNNDTADLTYVTHTKSYELKKNDKIYLRADTNENGWNDAPFINYIITNVTDGVNPVVYDLNAVAPTTQTHFDGTNKEVSTGTMGNYSFFYSNKNEKNTDNYGRMFPDNSLDNADAEAFVRHRAEINSPMIFWRNRTDSGDMAGYNFKMEAQADIDGAKVYGGCSTVAWTAPKDGTYEFATSTQNRGRSSFAGGVETAGEFKGFILPKGVANEPVDNLYKYEIKKARNDQNLNEVVTKTAKETLKKGDRVMLKLTPNVDSHGLCLFVKLDIKEVSNNVKPSLFTEKIFPEQNIVTGFDPWSVYLAKDKLNDFSGYQKLEHKLLKRDTIFVDEIYFGATAKVGEKPYIAYKPFNSQGTVDICLDRNKDIAKEDMIMCFTAPKNGSYNINFSGINAGTGLGGGDGGEIYISKLAKGATADDAYLTGVGGSNQFRFPQGGDKTPANFYDNINLNSGDRIILRIDPGSDGWNDLFRVKYVITNNVDNGAVYDLHNAAPSTMGNFSFYYMNKAETNTDKYGKTFPVAQGEPYAGWRGFPNKPFIFWRSSVADMNAQDFGYHFKMEPESDGDGAGCLAVGWTSPKDGEFTVDMEVYNKGRGQTGGTGAIIDVFKLPVGENMEPADKTPNHFIPQFGIGASSDKIPTKVSKTGTVTLKKGDRIMIKAKPHVDGFGLSILTKVNITQIQSTFEVDYTKNGSYLTSMYQLNGGDVVSVNATVNNKKATANGVVMTAIYDAQGKLYKVEKSASTTLTKDTPVAIPMGDFTLPSNIDNFKFKSFLLSSDDSIEPLDEAKELKY